MSPANNRPKLLRWGGAVCLAGAILAMAGCQEYRERRDTITFHAGDAVEANKAAHIVNPWPPASRRVHHTTNGERIGVAIDRYGKNEIVPQRSIWPEGETGASEAN